jgi:hypothetical protein
MAKENKAGTDKQEEMEEIERSFRVDTASQEEAAAHAHAAERERIARAILGEGENPVRGTERLPERS